MNINENLKKNNILKEQARPNFYAFYALSNTSK